MKRDSPERPGQLRAEQEPGQGKGGGRSCRRKPLVVKHLIIALGGDLLLGKLGDSTSLLSLSKMTLSEWGEGKRGWDHLCFNLGPGTMDLWEGVGEGPA